MKEKKREWIRKSLQLLPVAENRLQELARKYPFISQNLLVNIAIMNLDMGKVSLQSMSDSMDARVEVISRQTEAESKMLVGDWCDEFGGLVSGTNVHFVKYEMTMSGEVVRNKRAMNLADFPQDKDEVRKIIIGPFMSLTEAEDAYIAYQNKVVEEPAEELVDESDGEASSSPKRKMRVKDDELFKI